MKRILALWLTLLGAFWLTRELTSAFLFQRVDQGYEALAELLIVPALQTAVVAWLTRGRKTPHGEKTPEETRSSPSSPSGRGGPGR